MAGSQIALFGPQVTRWTRESLSSLQSALLKDVKLGPLKEALIHLPALWSLLQKDFGGGHFDGAKRLQELVDFATGGTIPDSETLSNTHLAPLTVICQVAHLINRFDGEVDRDESFSSFFQGAQGFCIGFLSAATLASSSNWTEFKRNITSSIRLATCIGLIIDAEDASHKPDDGATAVSARWKTHSSRTYLEAILDSYPEAYISCISDERTLTVTLPKRHQVLFCSQLNGANIATTTIDLFGSYHHPRHIKVAELLKRLCRGYDTLQLPSFKELRLPLRSTADAAIITKGALHEIAIDLILCKRAHWYQTVKQAAANIPQDEVKFITLGQDSGVIPRSLSLTTLNGLTNGVLPHHDTPDLASIPTEEIAVVGMACRFPQADSLEEFWQLLSSGGTSIGKIPLDRFNPSHVGREPKLSGNFWGNFLRQCDAFDHRFFGTSGKEAKSMDPQQRLALQVAYEALESSGYFSLPSSQETDVGCYLGVGAVEYEGNVASEDANAFSALGTLRAFISGRINHFFGWTGPSLTVDTACSSSAVAIHTACKAILNGECSMALAGGVNVITGSTLHQNLSAASFLNPNGSSRAFDATAGGYCRGEGAGLIVLKPLSKAIADGDTIIGVIAGSAVNQGSNCSSITVPDSDSQSALYKRALSTGGIDPTEVTYVEAHGTGTQVGDPIEYKSLQLALTGPSRTENLFVGSVKDNIGHCEAASGAAGVIKTLLMMQHKTIPKQANFATLNPRIESSSSDKIIVPKANHPWNALRHVALVNNYGAAGSNAAILLREHLEVSSGSRESTPSSAINASARSTTTYPILLSAKSTNNLQSYRNALQSYLLKDESPLPDIAYNLSRRQNSSFEHRIAFTATDRKGLIAALENSESTTVRVERCPVVLLFGGQTGRTVHVSRDLYNGCDLLRYHLDVCADVCRTLGLPSILTHLFQGEPIEDMVVLHCMLFSLQYSAARCWIDSGVEVDTVIGHSFGQITALCVAGSISLKDALRLISARACLIRDKWGPDRGVMLSVEGNRADIEAVVDTVNSKSGLRVEVACYNGPRSFVLAGDVPSMEVVEEQCSSMKTTRLQNTHAYHSYCADSILHGLKNVAESIAIGPPRIRVETCSTHESWPALTAERLVEHTRLPVYFGDAVERTTTRLPSAIWLEAGSASPIVAMARRLMTTKLERASDKLIPIDLGSAGAIANIAKASCQLWNAGSAAKFWLFHRSSRQYYKNLNLPPYQFDKTRHWIDYKPRSSEPPISESQKPAANMSNSLVSLLTDDRTSAGEYLFSVDINSAVFQLAARGHAVTGQGLCPASMYLELAARAAVSIPVLDTPRYTRTIPHLETLTMSAPLGLSGDVAVFLRLAKYAPQGTWEFSIFSQKPSVSRSSVSDSTTEHANGRISMLSPDDVVAESRLKLLKKYFRSSRADRILNSPLTTGVSGAMVYKLFSEVVEYANYYHGVKSLSALENEAVGLVNVSQHRPFGLDVGICDPISLDNFLQVAGIHVNCLSPRKSDQVFMCTAVEEVVFSPSAIANKLDDSRAWTVYTRYETISKGTMTNDIFVYDSTSKELVQAIIGATFRSVPFKSLERSLAKLKGAVRATTSTRLIIFFSRD